MTLPGQREAPREDYARVPGIRWSSLKYMSVSPRMYRYRLTHPEPRKRAWVIGGAIHCMVLEPDTFDEAGHETFVRSSEG